MTDKYTTYTHVYYVCAYIWIHIKSMKTNLSLKSRGAYSTWHWLLLMNSIPKLKFFIALPEMRDGFIAEGRKVGAMFLGVLFCLFGFLICLWFSFSNCVGRWTWSLKVKKENSSFKSTLQKNITSAVKNTVTIQATVWGQPQFWHR